MNPGQTNCPSVWSLQLNFVFPWHLGNWLTILCWYTERSQWEQLRSYYDRRQPGPNWPPHSVTSPTESTPTLSYSHSLDNLYFLISISPLSYLNYLLQVKIISQVAPIMLTKQTEVGKEGLDCNWVRQLLLFSTCICSVMILNYFIKRWSITKFQFVVLETSILWQKLNYNKTVGVACRVQAGV